MPRQTSCAWRLRASTATFSVAAPSTRAPSPVPCARARSTGGTSGTSSSASARSRFTPSARAIPRTCSSSFRPARSLHAATILSRSAGRTCRKSPPPSKTASGSEPRLDQARTATSFQAPDDLAADPVDGPDDDDSPDVVPEPVDREVRRDPLRERDHRDVDEQVEEAERDEDQRQSEDREQRLDHRI